MTLPSGGEAARPFLPAEDLAVSKAFYERLGFRKLLDSDVAIFAVGATAFIVAPQPVGGHGAENMMMQLMVDDLDAWWGHIESLDLPGAFSTPPPQAPAMQPWGLRVAYLIDPGGVLWHIAERRPGKAWD